MSIKKVKKVVQVKKYEEQEVDEHYCDVCETELLSYNTGAWYAVSYCSGEVTNEWSCPLDLCNKCIKFYSYFTSEKGISTNTARERYDGFRGDTESIAKELINAIDLDIEDSY